MTFQFTSFLLHASVIQDLFIQDGWPENAINFLDHINRCVMEITEVNFTATTDTAVETTTKVIYKGFRSWSYDCSEHDELLWEQTDCDIVIFQHVM